MVRTPSAQRATCAHTARRRKPCPWLSSRAQGAVRWRGPPVVPVEIEANDHRASACRSCAHNADFDRRRGARTGADVEFEVALAKERITAPVGPYAIGAGAFV